MINKSKVIGIIGNPLTPSRWEMIKRFLEEGQFSAVTFDSQDDLELKQALRDVTYVVVGGRSISGEQIEPGRQIKLIQILGSRTEHIDLASAQKIGVLIALMPWPHLAAVAEHSFMFILALTHKLLRGHRETVEGVYIKLGLTPTETSETKVAGNWTKIPDITSLYEKHLGIVGMGEIGQFLARQGHGFNMNISYYKRHRLTEPQEQALGINYQDFNNLLRQSDFVVTAVPHTPETEKMFGEKEFFLMKPSAFFINCSRGGIVDHGALYRALRDRVIAGAGLDVYEKEPIPIDNPILRLDNVVCTPHTAGTMEDVARGCKIICENIMRVDRGEPPQNLIRQ
jgi:phosphoglycerate dehydrogenase-like enzyme